MKTISRPSTLDPRLPSAATRLATLGRKVRDREETIGQLKDQFLARGHEYLAEVILQGADLLAAKELAGHGHFGDWLREHFPASDRTARTYMRLASNRQRASDLAGSASSLEEADSIRQALALILPPPDNGEPGTARSWPVFIEAVARITKWVKYVQKEPIDRWPEPNRDRLKTELEPIAKHLWPDRFQ
jgi:hypothetical protein